MLSGLVKNVTQTHKYKNFDMEYSDFPIIPGKFNVQNLVFMRA